MLASSLQQCARALHMAAAAGSTVLFVWGNNAYGKLGVGDISAEIKPTRLSHQFPSRCSHIAASGRSSAAIMDSGELYLWGDIYHGTKGTVHHTPQRVVFSPRTLVRAVSMGQAHVMALDAAGHLYTWGMGMDGRLGHGDTGNRDNPTLNEGLEAAGVAVIAIAAGTSHCLASDAEGSVWSWGCGLAGALGRGESEENCLSPTRIDTAGLTPTEMIDHPDGEASGRQVRCLMASSQTSGAVTVDGRIFTWGLGCYYALGLGTMENVNAPTEVQTLRYARIRQAALGPRHAAAVGDDGTLYTWGAGAHGRLGHGQTAVHRLPTSVGYFDGRRVVSVSIENSSAGGMTAVVTEDGACFTWGSAVGPLGTVKSAAGVEDAAPVDQLLPRAVEGGWHRDKQLKVAEVAIGHTHAVLLASQS